MQVRKMNELSDGQKSRVVLAKLGRDTPHILLLDEPTNHLGECRVRFFRVGWLLWSQVDRSLYSNDRRIPLRTVCLLTYTYSQLSISFSDMESIDALAIAVNEFSGGLVLVSHDMRLISQVAKEIWICDNKTITKYQGDIVSASERERKVRLLFSSRTPDTSYLVVALASLLRSHHAFVHTDEFQNGPPKSSRYRRCC
jgi:ATP-binding cassette subfamily F protein 2